ncbi:fibronectin type III domain-containing protein, partial [bacterium]|nr:fibronectin type III domain-containing protein [bacterium]
MCYWILILAVLMSPGIFAQEPADVPAPVAGDAMSATTETAESVESELVKAMEATIVIPEPTPVLMPPQNVIAEDVPDDDGGVLSVSWDPPAEGEPVKYSLEMAGEDGFFEELTRTMLTEYTIPQLENDTPYRFRVVAVYENGQALSEESAPAEPKD